jgi:phage shock protein A
MDELIESGTLEDFTTDKTQLDRELEALSSKSQVDSDLARLKAEVGAGEPQKELEQ